VDAPTDAVAGLEDNRLDSTARQRFSRCEAGEPGADDDDPGASSSA